MEPGKGLRHKVSSAFQTRSGTALGKLSHFGCDWMPMLSLRRYRELVGKDCRLSDEQLQRLAQQLYGLARVALDNLDTVNKTGIAKPFKPIKPTPPSGTEHEPSFADILALLSEDDRCAVEERAAIHEFDGGCTREQAEKLALDEFWRCKLEGVANE